MFRVNDPKNLTLVKQTALNKFKSFDEENQRWVYLGSIYEKNYNEIMDQLCVENENFRHGDPDHKKFDNCMTCGGEVTKHWIADKYCNSCFAHFNTVGHDNGDLTIPPHLATQGVEKMIGKGDIYMEFRGTGSTPTIAAAAFGKKKILLGAHEHKHCLYVGKTVIVLNPELCEVQVFKEATRDAHKTRLKFIIHEEIVINGMALTGNFNNCALVGNVVCDNAYLEECLSINEHKKAIVDGTTVGIFPNKEKLNELITNPGVVGVVESKATKSKPKTGAYWVSVGNFCPRCAHAMREKKEKNEIAPKAAARFVPREHYEQEKELVKKLELKVLELRQKNRVLAKTVNVLTCELDVSDDHRSYNK
jgi:hypothetical protein